MLHLKYTCLLLLFYFSATGQTTTISGLVIDKQSKKQVAGASLKIIDEKDLNNNIKQVASDSAGKYTLAGIMQGKYLIITSCVGYQADSIHIDLSKNHELGYQLNIFLSPQNIVLTGVEVTFKKPTIKFDRGKIIFDVKQTSFAAGNTAWDLLPKTPGVEANGNNISILGKSGAAILVNGRLTYLSGDQLVNYLKSIPGDQIDQIEVDQHPGAKYDMGQGTGVINIVLKKSLSQGVNGSATMTYAQGVYDNYASSVNLNYRESKLNVYGGFFYTNRENFINQPSYVNYLDAPLNPSYFKEDQKNIVKTNSFNFTAGLDYNLSKKSTIGFLFNGSVLHSQTNYTNNTTISNPEGGIDSVIKTTSRILAPNHLKLFNAYYSVKPDSLSSLTVNLDYGHYTTTNTQNYQFQFSGQQNTDLESFSNTVPGKIEIKAISVDYNRKLSKSMTLGAGIKSSGTNVNDRLSFYSSPSNGNAMLLDSGIFKYNEKINAAYLTLDKTFAKGSVQIGVRAENTATHKYSSQDNNTRDDQYLRLFPSLTYNYDFNAKNSITISYSTGFERPSYNYLTPFAIQRDPYSYSSGNPFLLPSYDNTFEIDYIILKKYTVAVEFDDIQNRIEQSVQQNESTKVLANIITNIKNNYYYRLYFILPVTVTKWWSSNNTVNNYIIQYKTPYLGGEYNVSKFVFYLNSINSFTLNPTTYIDLALNYRSPSLNGLYHIGVRKYADIGLKKTLFKKKAALSFIVSDIFNTNKWVYNIHYQDQNSGYTYASDSRLFKFSLTYKFGKTTVKSPKKNQTGIGDEKNRL